jgi:glycine/D-amino acid oxidase-like deaminating enzyme
MDLTSAQPFWPLNDGLLGVYPPFKQDSDCEVAILGGGITGALVADELVGEGVDVVLLDKRDIGHGSTSARTALLQYEIDTPLTELTKMIGQRDRILMRSSSDLIDSGEKAEI